MNLETEYLHFRMKTFLTADGTASEALVSTPVKVCVLPEAVTFRVDMTTQSRFPRMECTWPDHFRDGIRQPIHFMMMMVMASGRLRMP